MKRVLNFKLKICTIPRQTGTKLSLVYGKNSLGRMSISSSSNSCFSRISSKAMNNQLISHQYRMFSDKSNINQNSNKDTTNNSNSKNETINENKDSKEEKVEDEGKGNESTANFKNSRKFRFLFRKAFRFSYLLLFLALIYQGYLYRKRNTNDPATQLLYIEPLYKLIGKFIYFKDWIYASITSPYYYKLIPDVEMPGQKTLVLNLNKTLISYTYKMGKGFEIIKRPGLNKFLIELSNHYEIVVFGTEDSGFVDDICGKLDPHSMTIKYKLGREATSFELKGYVKDLRLINRNLKDVICIDFDPENVKYTPANTVIVPAFDGDVNDKELLQMIQFLKDLSKSNVRDVRKEIEKWGSYKPYINYYKSNPKYAKLLSKEQRS